MVDGLADDNFWSSSQSSDNANNAWNQNFTNGNQNDNNKDNDNRVRPVRGFRCGPVIRVGPARRGRFTGPTVPGWSQPGLFAIRPSLPEPLGDIDIADLFEAYRECRRNKRRTLSALAFESDMETRLVDLWREINAGTYRPDPATAFIVRYPVQREVFAATFRDRVVHHLIIRAIGPILDRDLIHDVYACRPGRGTLMGIRRLERFIRQCSVGYQRDCYVLRLDISGFFMNIDTSILLDRVEELMRQNYVGADLGRVMQLLRLVVLSEPAVGCRIRGSLADWEGLPPGKSLFHSAPGCGLPIGNLTSQVLANAYLSPLDHSIKGELGMRFYGRYVDDLVLVHPDRRVLARTIPLVRDYLRQELGLTLHPRKIVLQHHRQGVRFLGVVLKPGRTYLGRRAKGQFHEALARHSLTQPGPPTREQALALMASANSYLGLMAHFDTRRLRRRILATGLGRWWQYVYIGRGYRVVRLRHPLVGATARRAPDQCAGLSASSRR